MNVGIAPDFLEFSATKPGILVKNRDDPLRVRVVSSDASGVRRREGARQLLHAAPDRDDDSVRARPNARATRLPRGQFFYEYRNEDSSIEMTILLSKDDNFGARSTFSCSKPYSVPTERRER